MSIPHWSRSVHCVTLRPVSSGISDYLRAGKLSHYVTNHLGQLGFSSLRVGMSISYSWKGKGRYGSFQLQFDRVGVHVKLRSIENMCHTF